MCDAAGSDVEYAGMAVYTPHGGRGRSAAGSRENPAHGRQERLPQRLSSSPSGYPNGHDVPHGAQGSSGRLHSVLRHGAHAQGNCRVPRHRNSLSRQQAVYSAAVEQGRLKLGIPDKPSSRKQTFTTVQEQGEVL